MWCAPLAPYRKPYERLEHVEEGLKQAPAENGVASPRVNGGVHGGRKPQQEAAPAYLTLESFRNCAFFRQAPAATRSHMCICRCKFVAREQRRCPITA